MKYEIVPYKSHLPATIEPVKPIMKKRTFADILKNLVSNQKINWLEIQKAEYIKLKIIPDSSVRNWRTEDIMNTISDQFRLPIDRLITEGFKIKGFRLQERAAFEISFSKGQVNFFVHVPKNIAPLLIRRMQSVWDKATIEIVDEQNTFDLNKTTIYESIYRKHDMYSLHTDSTNNLPLGSLLEGGRLLGKEERASVFTYFDPIHQVSWNYEMNEAWTKLRGGKVPRKWNASAREIFKIVGVSISALMTELFSGISDKIGRAHV